MSIKTVKMTVNASGAACAAREGDVVVVVDIIDMSTTLEAALDAGALAVYGAAPDNAAPPVEVDPENVGLLAGQLAVEKDAAVVLVAEPRVGEEESRLANTGKVRAGLKRAGVTPVRVLPNIGAETPRLYNLRGCVVVAATGTGGVAFDAALKVGAPAVLTGTVARTMVKKGPAPAREAARRAVETARRLNAGITVVAASGNSLEDVLAAEYIMQAVLEEYSR